MLDSLWCKKMNDFNEIQEVMYNGSDQEYKDLAIKLDTAEELYVYAFNYNWDDGFDIPNLILNNSKCDLSIALLLFYQAEGTEFWKSDFSDADGFVVKEHYAFISKLHNDIVNGRYVKGNIQFKIPLSRVEKYKLGKLLSENEEVFLNDIAGKDLDVNL